MIRDGWAMSSSWLEAVPAFLTAVAVLIVPGAIVALAGWGARRVEPFLFAPAISVAIVSVSAIIAPAIGVTWSLLPVMAMTLVTATVAFLLRRRVAGIQELPMMTPGRVWAVTAIALVAAGLVLAGQFVWAFSDPTAIAQRFDNIVHLNAVRLAIESGNASPFQIGSTSDITFYPSGWHSTVALTIESTGAPLPVAVNASNLAVVAVVWPWSLVALALTFFGARRAAIVASAALAPGFGLFPALFFNWGVLYPNALGYALIPATLAAIARVTRSTAPTARLRDAILMLVVVGGCTLSHPNALLATLAMGGAYALTHLALAANASPHRRAILTLTVTAVSLLAVSTLVWRIARTPPEHSGWSPWQSAAQSFGEGLLVSARGFAPSWVAVVLIAAGLIAAIRKPTLLPAIAPFAAAVVLFVVASGFPIDHPLRQLLTNPWYNDPNRLAALLPIGAIPVATLGVVALSSWASSLWPGRSKASRWVRPLAWTVAAALLFSVAAGPNVATSLAQVREAYALTDDSLILSRAEQDLLERLPDEVEDDALIVGNPRTGTSLAYALAGVEVVEPHVFGSRTPEEKFLEEHLRDIETDPRVCVAIDDLGATHVLDFGDRDVMDDAALAASYAGMQNLTPSDHLVLVDSEGPDARLFRIDGC
jgi:hypothetical protein